MATPSMKKNFAYSTIYQVLNIITPFITAPYLSRVLGAEMLGIQSYTSSVQSYFLIFATLGTQSYGAREISRNRDNIYEYSKLFWEIELMTVATSMIALAAWGIMIVLSFRYKIYYISMIPYLFGSMLNITWFFNGLEKFKLTVIRSALFQIIGIVLMFIFVKREEDIGAYILILSITNLLSSASVWVYIPKYVKRISLNELKIMRHFRQTLLYFVPTIATSVYTVLDKTLIGLITKDSAQNGFYDQAEKVIRIAKSVSFSAINSVVGVRMSYLFAENKIEEIKKRIVSSMNYILFMGVGCACGIAAIARKFVPVFFGNGYDNVEYLLYILSPIIVVIGVGNCMGTQYYTPSGRRAQSSKYLIVGSCVNLILNLLLISRLQAFGAAIASIVAELVITSFYVKNSGEYMSLKILFGLGWRKVVAGIIMFVFVFDVAELTNFPNTVTVITQIVSGVGLYILLLYLLKDEWVIGYMCGFWNKVRKADKENG